MSDRVATQASRFIDEVTNGRLFLAFLALTFIPAVIFWQLSAQRPQDGLKVQDSHSVSFLDSLYFSVVNETTVGAGDIQARGISKAVVCAQVLLGLLFAGFAVAKVTSTNNRQLRLMGRKARGHWLAMNCLPDGRRIVSVVEIWLTANTISYYGANYSLSGDFLGTFDSHLSEVGETSIRFRYSNRDSSTEFFDEGISHLQFKGGPRRFTSYNATAHDFSKHIDITFEGFRANDAQCRKLNEPTKRGVSEVVAEFVESYSG